MMTESEAAIWIEQLQSILRNNGLAGLIVAPNPENISDERPPSTIDKLVSLIGDIRSIFEIPNILEFSMNVTDAKTIVFRDSDDRPGISIPDRSINKRDVAEWKDAASTVFELLGQIERLVRE